MNAEDKVVASATYRLFGRSVEIGVVRDTSGRYQLVHRGRQPFSTVRDLEAMLLPTESVGEEGYLAARSSVIKSFRLCRWLFPIRTVHEKRSKREQSPENLKAVRDAGGAFGALLAGCGCLMILGPGLLGIILLRDLSSAVVLFVGLVACVSGFRITGWASNIWIPERLHVGRRPIPAAVKKAVFSRDGGACVYCSSRVNIHFDHIIPHSRGGADIVENLQILCARCNLQKGAKIG